MPESMRKSVSVIIPVRNGERFLRQSLSSVLESEQFIREILIVNDGSQDRTCEIASEFPLVRICDNSGSGVACAYNEGVAQASGELIAFGSHDDLWCSGKLEGQLRMLDADPALQMVAGLAQQFLEDKDNPPPGFRPELLAPHVAFMPETLLIRKAVFDVVGLFDTSFTICPDVDWLARARNLGVRSGVVDEVVVMKRIHGGNLHMGKEHDRYLLQALHRSVRQKRQSKAT